MARRGKYKNLVRQSCCNEGMERKIPAEFSSAFSPSCFKSLAHCSTHKNLRRIADKGGEDLSLRNPGCFGRNVRLLLKKHGLWSIMEGTGWQVSSRKFRTVGINYELGVFLRLG